MFKSVLKLVSHCEIRQGFIICYGELLSIKRVKNEILGLYMKHCNVNYIAPTYLSNVVERRFVL